jgi:hypothetical protein
MKRKNSIPSYKNKSSQSSSQGFPYRVILNGKELKRVFQEGKKLEYSDILEAGNDTILIESPKLSLMLLKHGDNIVCLSKRTTKLIDNNDPSRYRNWCYKYVMYYIIVLDRHRQIDFMYYDIQKSNPYNIKPDYTRIHENISLICNESNPEPILIYDIDSNINFIIANKTFKLNLAIYCNIKQSDFEIYKNNCITILCIIPYFNIIFDIPEDVYNILIYLFKLIKYRELPQEVRSIKSRIKQGI